MSTPPRRLVEISESQGRCRRVSPSSTSRSKASSTSDSDFVSSVSMSWLMRGSRGASYPLRLSSGRDGRVASSGHPAPAPGEALARHRLRVAKLRATALLVVAAAIYLTTKLVSGGDSGVLGFVQAGADAGLVGGLADWFAVTALFRHPLGLPIPHTALVPRQKLELATKLGEFVTEHFLTSDLLAEQVRSQQLVTASGRWLRDAANAGRLAGETASLLAAGLAALDERNLVDYVIELVRRDAGRRSYAPIVGRLLAPRRRGRRPAAAGRPGRGKGTCLPPRAPPPGPGAAP